MSDNKDINFHSGDIKKKTLDFNVKEKKSTKFATSFDKFKKKVSAFPPLKGKNKFITLGVAILVVSAAITLPIVLPNILSPAPEQTTEEEQQEKQRVTEETVNTVNNVDPNASDDTKAAILSDLDTKIASASDTADKVFFIGAKANALSRFGQRQEAIDLLDAHTDEMRNGKYWQNLADAYAFIAFTYIDMDNNVSAIEYLEYAKKVIDEESLDSEGRTTLSGSEQYGGLINELRQ